MKPIITVFERSPDRGRGLARDMRVRWALEEAEQDYEVRTVSFEAMKQPGYLALQPFGQIPVYQEGDLVLFESGAIVLHVAERFGGRLLPEAPSARARQISWLFAAIDTVEPPVFELDLVDILDGCKPWLEDRRQALEGLASVRLDALAAALGESDWLDGAFGAGDLMMVTVLRRLSGTALMGRYPSLIDYIARGEARPAFQRAFAAQRTLFEASQAE
ncbi:glutathione S-transferase family protein [Novosphingobium aquimarinum]|uniref:glutathione S-transferase family protein n=1 Tax=Novosphingobium aquimarinum TaxID=2682494 RepID=UPI0012EBF9D3|nr:glutathione S-transferase family protein [Novosphingobium aquimarinum]